MNASFDCEWLLTVHARLHAASLEVVSRDEYVWLATKCGKQIIELPWEPAQRETFSNRFDRTAADELVEGLQPFWRWTFCKDVLAACSESPRGYPLLPFGETRVPPCAPGAAKPFVAAIGDMPSGDALVGEDAEGGEAEADGDADGVALGSEVADVEEGEEALLD